MIEYSKDGRTVHNWFESVAEMKEAVLAGVKVCNKDLWRECVTNSTWGRGQSWYGCENSEEAMRRIDEGWPELLAKLQPMMQKLRAKFELDTAAAMHTVVRRRKRMRGEHGDTLDMDRVWAGDLDHAWERPVKHPRLSSSQRYATIFVDLAANAHVTNEQMLWSSALAVCVVDVMTRMGINTEVWSGDTAHNCYPTTNVRTTINGVRVKEFTQPLNEDRMASALSAAFFRTWGFGMLLSAPHRSYSGLGSAARAGLPAPLQARKDAGERVFSVNGAHSEYEAVRIMGEIIAELKKGGEEEAA